MYKSLLLIAGIFLGQFSIAQSISGTISDQSGNPLPFVNIYINGTSTGTTSNYDGAYKLKIGSGAKEIVYQYIGYQKHKERVDLTNDKVIDVELSTQIIRLSEVTVSGAEDPANAIIRNAIDKRKFHLKQVQSYRCEAYVKGLMRITDIPEKILGFSTGIKADDENDQVVYLSESESILHFEKPDKIRETIISSKVSGDDQGFSWNSASAFYFDFYKNNVAIDQVSERVFISPIAYNAFMFYRYEFMGTFEDEGVLVNKIKVVPKRKNDPAFSGVINIVENLWNIHSLELFITRQNQINFLDTLTVEQYFLPVEKDIYMPISQKFDFSYSILQVKGDGYYMGIFKNYDVNLVFEKRFFTNEILKIEEGANEKDPEYWDQIRPIPLTQIEQKDYHIKDSLAVIKESDAYKDSMDRQFNKFSPMLLLTGYTYNNSKKNVSVTTNSLLNFIQFNTVEGVNIQLQADIRRRFENNRRYRISPKVRYGFSNKHLNASLNFGYVFNPVNLETVWLEGGKSIHQFNGQEPISELINSVYSLVAEENYMKFYEQYFFTLRYRREIIHGVLLNAATGWSERVPLQNTTTYSFKKNEESNYTSNDPVILEHLDHPMKKHQAVDLGIEFTFRFAEKYISRPNDKIRMDTRFPILNVSYKKSFNLGKVAQLNYDFLEFKIRDELPLALLGTSSYQLTIGGFVNNEKVAIPDFKHFPGNQTIFGQNYKTGFQLLEYYSYSTQKWFVETHYEHHFNGFLFNKIPLLRRLKFQTVAGAHFLYTPGLASYLEINAGIENILKILRVDMVAAVKKDRSPQIGFRLGLDLGAFN